MTGKHILLKSNALVNAEIDNSNIEYKFTNLIFNETQLQKGNDSYFTIINIDAFRDLSDSAYLKTAKGILSVLEDKFQKNTLKWCWGKEHYQVTLITKIKFNHTSGDFTIYIDKDLVNFLLNYRELRTGYTPLNLRLTNQSKSFFTQRIYELLRLWSGEKKEIEYDLEDLKVKLLLQDHKSYKKYKEFKRRVLVPALKEINEKLNMNVDYEEIRVGRCIAKLKFIVEDLEPRSYDFNKDKFLKEQISMDEIALDLNISTSDNINVRDDMNTNNNINPTGRLNASNIINVKDNMDIDLPEGKTKVLLNNKNKFSDVTEKLNDSGIKIAISTINRFKTKYGEELVKKSVSILCNKVKQQKITAPVKYLKGILENLDKNSKDNEINNTKKLKFNNFEPREYDYDELEKKLLGWDK
ncbi:replication initiation protein [Clostridium botulinum]|uniref:Replication initiation protein n=1 Tax=Clostridium botulinum TaxID=1491 RepID=A0A6M0V382_CLOBO|nr:replication initiation protein [Clostridium botulinum]MCS6112588.1 RepB family plasmid replication initiator protein [Clostridium botulinum]NFE13096.1 replication initiation protein [Clostridium botulinum]NFE61212.1 replication initiation protein [Clostridium botulinum]NFF87293.1 replication initiation protein [Clostridium botulinum]NFG11346.1 replication initiation protein [Clostridium botulinum]